MIISTYLIRLDIDWLIFTLHNTIGHFLLNWNCIIALYHGVELDFNIIIGYDRNLFHTIGLGSCYNMDGLK